MKNIFEKLINKVLPFVLCICIVSGAVTPAYADDSTSGYSYYRAGSTLNPYTQQLGKNSADMIGRLLDVSSYNQAMIYNRLLQMSTSGSDLTTINSYITAIDSKLGVIRDSLGIGSSLENVLSNQTSNLQHLNTIINKLSYWDNNHGRSYDLSEMIFNIMENDSSIVENTSSIPAIANHTYNLFSVINKTLSPSWTFTNRQTPTGNLGVQNRTGYQYPQWNIDSGLGSYRYTYTASQNGLIDLLSNLNLISNFTSQEIMTPYTIYRALRMNNRTGVQEYVTQPNGDRWNAVSIMDLLSLMQSSIDFQLGTLTYFFADADTIAAKKANASQTSAFVNNFTGSGSASATASDFGVVRDSIVDLKAGFTGGASSSDTFSFLSGDSNAWDWFTQDTANDVDRTQRSNTRLLRGSSNVASDTPLLDSYYNSILSILRGDE